MSDTENRQHIREDFQRRGAPVNRLMLLAGGVRREGWHTLDIKGGDFTARIPPLPAEVCGIAWDEVELIHGINMFYPWDGEALLHALHEVMQPGGQIILEQPNFGWLVAADADGYSSHSPVYWFFGDPALRDPDHMVKWAYSPISLTALVQRCGFRDVEILSAQHHVPGRDFRLEAKA